MYRCSLLLLPVFVFFVGTRAGPSTQQDPLLASLIVGGQDADISAYPYQVSVRIRGVHTCGAALIATNVVLTAAHCMNDDAYTEKDYSIQYGVTRIGGNENVIGVNRLIANDQYNSETHDYDIGLIILASDVPQGPNAQFISLATVRPAVGTNAVVTGWGSKDTVSLQSVVLQSVTLQIISNEDCQKQYTADNMAITDRMLCAGVPAGGKDSCQGDSGGPLVANGQLVGIVSGGHGCGEVGFYGVYMDVANLRDWILEGSL